MSDIERHPGPFIGPDIELARAIAMAVIPWYGNDDAATHQRIMQNGIWNDHIAVQAALAAIHHLRPRIAALEAALREVVIHNDNTTLPESVRIPLNSLQADLGYLIGRVIADGLCGSMVVKSMRERLDQIEAGILGIAYTCRDGIEQLDPAPENAKP